VEVEKFKAFAISFMVTVSNFISQYSYTKTI
jgi:hypothetical protein